MHKQQVLDELARRPYGVYAVDASQTIIFWNAAAERSLGHRSVDMVGRKCHDANPVAGLKGLTPACEVGCPSVHAANWGDSAPRSSTVMMTCADGRRKAMTVTSALVESETPGDFALIRMMIEVDVSTEAGRSLVAAVIANERAAVLSPRELDVLRLCASGFEGHQIAKRLFISHATVRKHVLNIREKLSVPTIASAVAEALRRGLI